MFIYVFLFFFMCSYGGSAWHTPLHLWYGLYIRMVYGESVAVAQSSARPLINCSNRSLPRVEFNVCRRNGYVGQNFRKSFIYTLIEYQLINFYEYIFAIQFPLFGVSIQIYIFTDLKNRTKISSISGIPTNISRQFQIYRNPFHCHLSYVSSSS